jgi:ring-1,2-phenylacetyl-CoA epoxidase subunit PaaE
MNFYKLIIKDITRETPSAVSIAFNIPEELKNNFQFIAGQYVTLKLTLDGQEVRRAYSICSSPKSNELRVSVKEVKNGLFSKFANQNLKVGDLLEVSEPEGKFVFTPNQDKQKNYMAFAAGSGITPVFSIIKSVLEEENNSSIVLIYGNKTPEDTIFHDELIALESNNLGRFTVQFIYSQANSNAQELHGRIDKSVVNHTLNKHETKVFDQYFLCGPEEMINTVSAVLKEKNVSEKNIKFELFSSGNTKETSSNLAEGSTQITIMVDGEEISFEMSQKQTILEAALKEGVDVPYSCQGGICSSCICRVTEGTATMKKNQILTDNEVAEGLTLACQAYTNDAKLYIDFDNV